MTAAAPPTPHGWSTTWVAFANPAPGAAPAVAEVVDAAGGRYTVRYLTRLYLARPLH